MPSGSYWGAVVVGRAAPLPIGFIGGRAFMTAESVGFGVDAEGTASIEDGCEDDGGCAGTSFGGSVDSVGGVVACAVTVGIVASCVRVRVKKTQPNPPVIRSATIAIGSTFDPRFVSRAPAEC